MRRFERVLIVAVCVAIGWFYVWTTRSSGEKWRWGIEQEDYYNLLIDGWLDGHLYMKVAVPEALLKLPDPYDPQKRPSGLALHDASLYRGHYYVYFGAAPVALLMLPARLLTGVDMPLAVAVMIFAYGGFLASAWTWLAIRRRHFAESGPVAVVAGLLGLGLAGLGPMLLRRTHMWELPIAAGYCFAMLTLGCLWQSLGAVANGDAERRHRSRIMWFGAAGLCLGLAIASRPTYLIASPLLTVPLLWWWRTEKRLPWRTALAAVIPLACVGALMALHNYLRFDNPLQFGQAYQLSLDYESKMAHFRPSYLRFNGWRYFFSAAQWTWHFPFIQPALLPQKPAGFGGHDDVFGLFTNLPVAWLALLAPFAAWKREPAERGPLLAWLGTAAVLFLAMATVLCMFFGSLARYLMDFAPTLMLLACIGVLATERLLASAARAWTRVLVRIAWGAALIYAVGFGVLYSLQLDSLLLERNPALYREVARSFNRVSYLLERAVGRDYGPVELTVRLLPRPPGTQETLLATGHPPEENRVFVRYLAEDQIQLGCEGVAGAPQLSRPLSIDLSRPHQIRVAMGALYPPETHPYFAGFAPGQITDRTRRLRLECDGETLIDTFLRSPEATRGNLRIAPAAANGAGRFSGEVLRFIQGETKGAAESLRRGYFARMWVEFSPPGNERREALVTAADGSRADAAVLFLHYLGGNRITLAAKSAGSSEVESAPFTYEPGSVGAFIIRLDLSSDAQTRQASVWLNDTIVWSAKIPWIASGPIAIAAGAPADATFSKAQVHGSMQSANGNDALLGTRGAVRLHLEFPKGQTGKKEPLVVSGRNGQADVVAVEYVDGGHVRFGFDHWGSVFTVSDPVSVDYSQPHVVEIDLGSGGEPPDPLSVSSLRHEPFVVKLDGRTVWEYRTLIFNNAREEMMIGRNAVGASTCEPRFTGRILNVERNPR